MPISLIPLLAALADEDRVAVLGAVAGGGASRMTEIAVHTGLPPVKVRKAVSLLAGTGLVLTTADGSLSADLAPIRAVLEAEQQRLPLIQWATGHPRIAGLLRYGRIMRMPIDPELRTELCAGILDALPPVRQVPESTLNGWLAELGDDVALLRRTLVDAGSLRRDPHTGVYDDPRISRPDTF